MHIYPDPSDLVSNSVSDEQQRVRYACKMMHAVETCWLGPEPSIFPNIEQIVYTDICTWDAVRYCQVCWVYNSLNRARYIKPLNMHSQSHCYTPSHKERNKMHFHRAILGLGLSLVAGTAFAQQAALFVTNKCSETVYVIYSNNEYHAAAVTLTSGKGFEVILDGEGMDYTRSKGATYGLILWLT